MQRENLKMENNEEYDRVKEEFACNCILFQGLIYKTFDENDWISPRIMIATFTEIMMDYLKKIPNGVSAQKQLVDRMSMPLDGE